MIKGFWRLVQDIRHGLSLKLMALASRGVFLFIVVPRLVAGELTNYVFLSTVAVLSARVISMGMEEQLPLRIAGRRDVAEFMAPLVGVMIVLEVIFGLVFVATGHFVFAIALLTCCYVTTSLFAGLLRSVNVSASERLRDLHWLIFGAVCLMPYSWAADQLIVLLSASLMCIHLLELRLCGIPVRISAVDWGVLWTQTRPQIGRAWKKLFAGLSLTADIRGIVFWPSVLGLGLNLDNIVYALLLGEAFWQTSAVLVHRRYAKYCVMAPEETPRMKKDAFYTSLVLIVYACIAAFVAFSFGALDIVIGRFSDWTAVAFMFLFFGMISCYFLLRYLTWVIKDFDWALVGFEVLLILAQGLLILMFDQSVWVFGLFFLAAIFLTVVFGYVMVFVKSLSSGCDSASVG